MTPYLADVLAVAKRPSATVPLLMSLTALALVLGSLLSGVGRQADEGPTAHLFQMLVVGQLPVLAFFGLKWLRKEPRAAFTIMAAQAVALALALFPVWYFSL